MHNTLKIGAGGLAAAFMLIAFMIPVADETRATDDVQSDDTASAFDLQMEAILAEQTRAKENDKDVADILNQITRRLIAVEDSLDELKEVKLAEIVEPPAEPPKANTEPTDLKTVIKPGNPVTGYTEPAGYTAGLHILANYSGQRYVVKRHQGDEAYLRRHIVGHGHPTGGLDRFSNHELERIHGAYHTNHWSTRGETPTSYKPPKSAKVFSGSIQIGQPYYTNSRGQRVNCPNGVCPTVRYYRR